MSPSAASLDPAQAGSDRGVPDCIADELQPRVRQEFSGSGTSQLAVLWSGTQNVYLGEHAARLEPAVSIAPPTAQRVRSLPLRGREPLLAELVGSSARVRVLHGMGGCGKTRLALEAAFAAQQGGIEVWWI